MIATERLRLLQLGDIAAQALQQLANSPRIADTTISVPHPFTQSHAETWIAAARDEWTAGRTFRFAIERASEPGLIGYVALYDVDREHRQAEISFWLGDGHEGHGYMFEAARAAIAFAFETAELNRLCAYHMVRNTASQALLARLGFVKEGLLRQRVRKAGRYEDVLAWALLREDWQATAV